jgi:hypothetical protein
LAWPSPATWSGYKLHEEPGHETVFRAGYGIFYDLGSALGSGGYYGLGFSSTAVLSSVSYPLTAAQLAVPPPSIAAPYSGAVIYAFDPNLKLPYSTQYNVSVEQALTPSQNITVSYVGSLGRDLLTNFMYYPNRLGNPNFAASTNVYITSNGASSSYNSFQAQYQRSLSKGLQALVSYTWSHSIDDASANALLTTLLRSDSDYDIRHRFQAAITYDVPSLHTNKASSMFFNHWGTDLRFQGRASLPSSFVSSCAPTLSRVVKSAPRYIGPFAIAHNVTADRCSTELNP